MRSEKSLLFFIFISAQFLPDFGFLATPQTLNVVVVTH
jgi:hypothetical protein